MPLKRQILLFYPYSEWYQAGRINVVCTQSSGSEELSKFFDCYGLNVCMQRNLIVMLKLNFQFKL